MDRTRPLLALAAVLLAGCAGPGLPPLQFGEMPVADVPVAEMPVADVPVADVPVADVPVAEMVVSELPATEGPRSAARASVPDPFALPAEVVADFRARIGTGRPERARLDALIALFRPDGPLALDFDLTESLDAADTLAAGRGNCLSFTIAFVALARALDLDARVQEVVIPGVWSRSGEMVVANRHAVAWGRLDGAVWEVDFGRFGTPGAAPRRLLDDAEVAATLSSNRGAAALVEGRDEAALVALRHALAIDPELDQAWTNLAVAEARLGRPAAAEQAFRRALEQAPGDASALTGLLRLYRSRGRTRAADRLEAALPRLLARNPYYLYDAARGEEARSGFDAAALLYRRALRTAPLEPWFHAGLIRTRLRAGDGPGAQRALAAAQDRLTDPATRALLFAALRAHPAADAGTRLAKEKTRAGPKGAGVPEPEAAPQVEARRPPQPISPAAG